VRGKEGSVRKPKKKPAVTLFKRTQPPSRGPTCIDFFSGAGGLAEGFRQAGWAVLAANDIDSDAGATFRLNFPEASFFEGHISNVNVDDLLADADLKIGQLDCLLGGPPCQSFSYNNHQRSASDVRARLFRKYLEFVSALKPKTLVMENVPGMLTIGDGRIVQEIKSALQGIGYNCEIRILYAEDFGVPQTRRRAFIVASRLGPATELIPPGNFGPSEKPSVDSNPLVHRWMPSKRNRPKRLVTVGQAIGDLPRLRSGGGAQVLRKQKKAATNQFQRSVREGVRGCYNHVCHELTKPMLTRIAYVPEGGNWADIPRRLLTAGMRRARKNCHTKRYGRLARDELASTLLTKCDPHWGAYVHPTQNRTISVREAARLQGFPDCFRFAGTSISQQYAQVGNAVPVPIGVALGLAFKKHLKRRRRYKVGKRSARIAPIKR
jgi:DNA (cytosine-5)-methyltransferase 1